VITTDYKRTSAQRGARQEGVLITPRQTQPRAQCQCTGRRGSLWIQRKGRDIIITIIIIVIIIIGSP
jgi:biotin-(acetyl-CoA carboxylase) ligase